MPRTEDDLPKTTRGLLRACVAALLISSVSFAAEELLAEAKPVGAVAPAAFQLIRAARTGTREILALRAGSQLLVLREIPAGAERYSLALGASAENAALRSCLLSVRGDSARDACWELTAWLTQPSAGKTWELASQWCVFSKTVSASGDSRDESQTFALDVPDALTRRAHFTRVDTQLNVQSCGCCKALQTKTVETFSEEHYNWDTAARTLRPGSAQRWYVAFPGENLMHVAKKVYDDPRLLSKLMRLNPKLNAQVALGDGQRVLIEK